MLVLNNKHSLHDTVFTWIPKQDYSADGYVIYPRGSRVRFKGSMSDDITLINKVFHEGMDRDNIQFIINSVAQYDFKKDDIIEDEEGKKYRIVSTRLRREPTQAKFLKTSYRSKEWWIGVEGYE